MLGNVPGERLRGEACTWDSPRAYDVGSKEANKRVSKQLPLKGTTWKRRDGKCTWCYFMVRGIHVHILDTSVSQTENRSCWTIKWKMEHGTSDVEPP